MNLFDHYADNNKIKLKINGMESNLGALNQMIKNRERCRVRKNRPIDPDNKEQIENIIKNLKKLKRPQGEMSLVNCKGVVLSLELNLKKVLKIFNYSFACSEGLEDLEKDR